MKALAACLVIAATCCLLLIAVPDAKACGNSFGFASSSGFDNSGFAGFGPSAAVVASPGFAVSNFGVVPQAAFFGSPFGVVRTVGFGRFGGFNNFAVAPVGFGVGFRAVGPRGFVGFGARHFGLRPGFTRAGRAFNRGRLGFPR